MKAKAQKSRPRALVKMYESGPWKHAASHAIDRSNMSGIKTAVTNRVLDKWRLFNAELRMLAARQRYKAAIADEIYTVLLMQEP